MTQSESHASHSPQCQAQRAFPPVPQILGGGGAMTARRFLPLARALLVACLAASAFEARAVEVIINDAVTRTNNNVILDGNDKITINKGGSITVDEMSPGTVGPDDSITNSNNVAVLLRGLNVDGVLIADSNKNKVTNLGTITASGPNARGG